MDFPFACQRTQTKAHALVGGLWNGRGVGAEKVTGYKG